MRLLPFLFDHERQSDAVLLRSWHLQRALELVGSSLQSAYLDAGRVADTTLTVSFVSSFREDSCIRIPSYFQVNFPIPDE